MKRLSIGNLMGLMMGLLITNTSLAGLDDITVMALGPLDGRAVIKTADGKMKALKVGDTVPGSKAVVKQVLNDKLVVEELLDTKPPRKQTVWIYKPRQPGAKSMVQQG